MWCQSLAKLATEWQADCKVNSAFSRQSWTGFGTVYGFSTAFLRLPFFVVMALPGCSEKASRDSYLGMDLPGAITWGTWTLRDSVVARRQLCVGTSFCREATTASLRHFVCIARCAPPVLLLPGVSACLPVCAGTWRCARGVLRGSTRALGPVCEPRHGSLLSLVIPNATECVVCPHAICLGRPGAPAPETRTGRGAVCACFKTCFGGGPRVLVSLPRCP